MALIERIRFVQYVLNLIGTNYIYGGKDEKGLDCSGTITFPLFVLSGKKLDLRGTFNAQRLYTDCPRVGPENVKPGDLCFYGGSKVDHVMMLLYKPLGSFIPGMVVGACGGDHTTIKPTPGAKVQVRRAVRYRPVDDFVGFGSMSAYLGEV